MQPMRDENPGHHDHLAAARRAVDVHGRVVTANRRAAARYRQAHYGFLIAQIFFGLWLVPLGYLAYKSAMFPKVLSVLLIAGGACYLVGTLAALLIPSFGQKINTVITIPSAIAEICMVVYLLVISVRTQEPDERIPAPDLISSGGNSQRK